MPMVSADRDPELPASDITEELHGVAARHGWSDGALAVLAAHSSSLVVLAPADPAKRRRLIAALGRLVDAEADAAILANALGAVQIIPIVRGAVELAPGASVLVWSSDPAPGDQLGALVLFLGGSAG
jgi:thiamine phosphate synthase YjbQ (UPF0047 family)